MPPYTLSKNELDYFNKEKELYQLRLCSTGHYLKWVKHVSARAHNVNISLGEVEKRLELESKIDQTLGEVEKLKRRCNVIRTILPPTVKLDVLQTEKHFSSPFQPIRNNGRESLAVYEYMPDETDMATYVIFSGDLSKIFCLHPGDGYSDTLAEVRGFHKDYQCTYLSALFMDWQELCGMFTNGPDKQYIGSPYNATSLVFQLF